VSGSADLIGTNARFATPTGITSDGANLYVTDVSNHTIRKIIIASAEVSTIAGQVGVPGYTNGIGTDARFNSPYGITTDGTNLYVCDYNNYVIRVVSLADCSVTTLAGYSGIQGYANATGSNARFRNPSYVTTDGTYLYVTDSGSSTIRRVRISDKAVTAVAGLDLTASWANGTGTAAFFNYPMGITTDGVSLFVADYNNNVIRIIQ
jgi:sugar lactone lactonase YvrE